MKRLAIPMAVAAALGACGNQCADGDPLDQPIAAAPIVRSEADPTRGVDQALHNSSTTTTTASTRSPSRRGSRSTAPARRSPTRPAGGAVAPGRAYGVRLVSSTAYCLTGTMANGQRVYSGAVAMNGVPFGTRYRVVDGPLAGQVLTVADRIGHSSQFDIAMPGDCAAARRYGRRSITIEQVA